jgi:hypothetical protein
LTRTCLRLACILIGSAFAPFAAAASALPEVSRPIDFFSLRWWVTHLMLQAVVLVAYFASSLPKWAKWIDGVLLDRLTITQGVLVSFLAGNVAWFLFYYYSGAHEALCWVMAVIGSYFGEPFLRMVLERFAGKLPDPPGAR